MRKKDGIQCNIQKCLELHKSCCFAWMLFQAHLTVKALLMICEMPRLHNRFSCICTLGVQGSIWFFGAETPQSGVILVAGREPICLVCLAAGAFLLPKNSAGMLPLVHRGYDCMIAQRVAFRLIIPLFSGKSCIRKYSCCCLPAAFPGNAR